MSWEDIIKIGYIPSDAKERGTATINWMEAFDKFGFDDGHENNGQTEAIAQYLRKNNYEVNVLTGGHNTYIRSVLLKKPKSSLELHYGFNNRSAERNDFNPKLLELLDRRYGKSMKSEGIKG